MSSYSQHEMILDWTDGWMVSLLASQLCLASDPARHDFRAAAPGRVASSGRAPNLGNQLFIIEIGCGPHGRAIRQTTHPSTRIIYWHSTPASGLIGKIHSYLLVLPPLNGPHTTTTDTHNPPAVQSSTVDGDARVGHAHVSWRQLLSQASTPCS